MSKVKGGQGVGECFEMGRERSGERCSQNEREAQSKDEAAHTPPLLLLFLLRFVPTHSHFALLFTNHYVWRVDELNFVTAKELCNCPAGMTRRRKQELMSEHALDLQIKTHAHAHMHTYQIDQTHTHT